MRRGLEADFDPNKMQPGEWAVSTDTKYVRMCFSPGVCVRMATYEAFEADMAEIQSIMAEARTIQEAVARIQTEINNTAIVVEDYAILSKSYAVGGTGTRIGEDTDNSKYYSELAKTESDKATTEADRAKTEADRAYSIVNIGIATTEKAGIVKPDGTTITVDADGTMHSVGGGGTAGTMDYEDLSNKPSVNGIELSGNKTTSDLGITAESVGADAVGSASTALSNAKDYTDTKISDLVGGAPATLDTLKEISDALTESREVVEAINQAIGNKIDKDGDSKDNTVTFTQANTRENILPTEKHSTLFGKIAKWFADLKAVAFSGSYNDLSNKPTIPTVNDATLTIQKNGNTVQTFTANASSNKTANIIVPTKTSELENDSGFMGSATALDTYEEIMANTESGKFAGAKGVKEGFSKINNSLGGVSFGVDTNGNRGYYDASGEFVNFSDGDGGFILGVTDITNFKNASRGFYAENNKAITLGKEYDLSKYKYIQLIYQDCNYYNRTWGVGYTKKPNDSYANCVATSNKKTASGTGTSQNTYTTKTIYLDISDVNEKGYPFVYLTSSIYSYILKLQLVNELEEI